MLTEFDAEGAHGDAAYREGRPATGGHGGNGGEKLGVKSVPKEEALERVLTGGAKVAREEALHRLERKKRPPLKAALLQSMV